MPEEHTLESTVNKSSGQILQLNHKPKKTRIPEDPKDIDTSSEGLKSSSEDHQVWTEEKKEILSSSKKRKSTNKASIISIFNALYPLSWLHQWMNDP